MDASVEIENWMRLLGPRTVQFNTVGLSEVNVNGTRSLGGRGYDEFVYGSAPTMDGDPALLPVFQLS